MNASAHLKFPRSKELASGSSNARRDDGAHNQSLPCSEAELVSFTAPIARHTPEAHETPKLTRDGNGVLTVVSCGQLPGCLPPGYDLDSMLTPEEFCVWQGIKRGWFKARRRRLPGVIFHSREMIRIHPRTYLEKSVKGMK